MFNKLKKAAGEKDQPTPKKLTKAEKIAQKEQVKINDAHKLVLEKNLETVKELWKEVVGKVNDLGYEIKPEIAPAMFPGMYQGLINLKGMNPEQYDRHQNPEKWVEIDKERKAATEKVQKEAEAQMKKEANESKEAKK